MNDDKRWIVVVPEQRIGGAESEAGAAWLVDCGMEIRRVEAEIARIEGGGR